MLISKQKSQRYLVHPPWKRPPWRHCITKTTYAERLKKKRRKRKRLPGWTWNSFFLFWSLRVRGWSRCYSEKWLSKKKTFPSRLCADQVAAEQVAAFKHQRVAGEQTETSGCWDPLREEQSSTVTVRLRPETPFRKSQENQEKEQQESCFTCFEMHFMSRYEYRLLATSSTSFTSSNESRLPLLSAAAAA